MRTLLVFMATILVCAALLLAARREPPAAPSAPATPAAAAIETTAPEDAEPTREDCVAAVDKAQALANALPKEHPSRYFAERHLHQSMAEAGNGEFDDCLYWAAAAFDEVRELRHQLQPGETLGVLRPDETPAPPAPAQSAEKKPLRDKARK
ncbi:hypothetical protein [Methylosinus sp. PW1]|uniref:hypothetical protein n=1 Tax=Methylosinus sp. PW1 TaxID=107636 RepID=UPI001FDA5A89|nr:hypothetical protein [Methylosinus sp. PW1]